MLTSQNNLQEKIISWFWVILFISSVLYLRWLLVEMHSKTERFSEEQQRFQAGLEKEREKSEELYQEFYAEINKTINRTIQALNCGEIPYKYFEP